MPVTHAAVSGEANPGDGRVGGEDWDADHVGQSDWDIALTKGSDQSVTNSTVMVPATGLSFDVTPDSVWRVEYDIIYSSDATGDFRWEVDWTTGASVRLLAWRHIGSDTTANALQLLTGGRIAGLGALGAQPSGGGATTIRRSLFFQGIFEFDNDFAGTATVTFEFAQNTATVGQSAVLRAGSRVRARRLF